MIVRRFMLTVLVIIFRYSSKCFGTDHDSEYYSVVLSPPDDYVLYWRYDNNYVTFEVHARCHGYVGLGVSPSGTMTGADIALAWVNNDGTAVIQDRYSRSRSEPTLDRYQDLHLISGRENATHTIVKFTRMRDTCDDQDIIISEGTIGIIWSYSLEDPERPNEAGSLDYHGNVSRGSRHVELITKREVDPRLPKDVISWEFRNPGVSIPDMDTLYWCQYFETPTFGQLKHVVMIEPVLQIDHTNLVRHILLFGCQGSVSYRDNVGTNCPAQEVTSEQDRCDQLLFAWAAGGGPFFFPSHVGAVFGGPGFPKILRMETHFDNPARLTGYTDTSGLRLWLTSDLRAEEAGVMQAGIIPSRFHIIPPNSTRFTSSGYCVADCLGEAAGEVSKGINVFATLLQTHQTGTAVRVRHVRAGTEQAEVTSDPSYTYDLQDTRILPQERRIRPTDDLIVECSYTTKNKLAMVVGGAGGRMERCVVYLWYYPRLNISSCQSVPTPRQSLQLIDAKVSILRWSANPFTWYRRVVEPRRYMGLDPLDALRRVSWTTQLTQRYQDLVRSGMIISRCQSGYPHTYKADNAVRDTPNVTRPLHGKAARACSRLPSEYTGTGSRQPIRLVIFAITSLLLWII